MNAATLSAARAAEARYDRTSRFAIAGIGLYLVGKMAYVFSGGSVQPADALLVLVTMFIAQPHAFQQVMQQQRAFAIFVGWVQVVNIGWAAATGQTDFIVYGLFYVFNFVIVVCVFAARNRDPDLFDTQVVRWLHVAIVIQFLATLVLNSGGRSLGTFRNPNQLSYWVICTISLLLVLRRNNARMVDLPFLFLALWCQVGSASRAGLGGTLMLILIWAFFALQTPLKRVLGFLAAALLVLIVLQSNRYAAFSERSDSIARAEARLARQDQQSQLDVRNYSRIRDYVQYTVIGAGEGYLKRFRRFQGEEVLEIHSSFGTLLFSYGVVGLTLFLLFLGRLALSLRVGEAVYLVPSLFYGLTHQGLRFSFFWIVIGVFVSIVWQRRHRARALPAPATAPVVREFEPRGADFLREKMAQRSGRRAGPISPQGGRFSDEP